MDSHPDWTLLASAKSFHALKSNGITATFTSIFQAYLPNPDKPPLFVDLPAYREGDQVVIDTKLTARLRESFLLESAIAQYADNLKSLHGLKFDWPRNDPIENHIKSGDAWLVEAREPKPYRSCVIAQRKWPGLTQTVGNVHQQGF